MKYLKIIFFVLIITILFSFALPIVGYAAPLQGDRIVMGETYILDNGHTLEGSLTIIGGVVEVKEMGVVNGDVISINSVLMIDGTINGDLTIIGGTVTLSETAKLDGNLVDASSFINLNPNALITGYNRGRPQISSGVDRFTNFDQNHAITKRFYIPTIIGKIAKIIGTILTFTVLGALLLLIFPTPFERMRKTLINSPWVTFGFGALTFFAGTMIIFIMIITICLVPLAILLALALTLASLFGWLALGYQLGKLIEDSLSKPNWHPVLTAIVGNFVLSLVVEGLNFIPCLGHFIIFMIYLLALGVGVITLFGTQTYPRSGNRENKSEDPIVLFQNDNPTSTNEPKAVSLNNPTISESSSEESADQNTSFSTGGRIIATDLSSPIDELHLSTRVTNLLKEAGILKISDLINLLEFGDQKLMEIEGFGKKAQDEVIEKLKMSGFLNQSS